MEENVTTYLVECMCAHPEHTMILRKWNEEKEIYVAYHLNVDYKLTRRIVDAVLHIFGKRSKYGNFGEVILNEEGAKKLAEFLKFD